MVVAVPRSLHTVGPEALQVGRQAAGPGAADKQVAAIVIVEGSQSGRRMVGKAQQALVGGQGIVGRSGQEKRHTVVETAVGCHMSLEQGTVGGTGGLTHLPADLCLGCIEQTVAHLHISPAGEVGAFGLERGSGRDYQPCFLTSRQSNTTVGDGTYGSTLIGHHTQTYTVGHTRLTGIATVKPARQHVCLAADGSTPPLLTVQKSHKRKGTGLVGRKVNEHDIEIARHKVFAPVVYAGQREGCGSHGIAQRKRTLVAADPGRQYGIFLQAGMVVGKEQFETGQHLVGAITAIGFLLLGNKAAIHQFLRLPVASFEKQLADSRQTVGSKRIAIVALRTAPERYFVQDNVFLPDAAVGHHAQTAIAQRQCLLPDGSRRGIVKAVIARIGRRRCHSTRTCRPQEQAYANKQCFH